jgi:CheY-like chemotaxis protein
MGAKLLLADDSVTIQKVVELTLADEDYDISMVSDGAAALKLAEELRPDMILADIVMPEMTGYELCEQIRKSPILSTVPVLLLSSTFENYDTDRGTRVGANGHIVKPFESEDLIQKIRQTLDPEAAAAPATDTPAEMQAQPVGGPAPAAEAPAATPEIVEDEEFEFELTDEFMNEAEEMFDESEKPSAATAAQQTDAIEELLPNDFSDAFDLTEEMMAAPSATVEETPEASVIEMSPPEPTSERHQEITPELVQEESGWGELETEPESVLQEQLETPPFEAETPAAPESAEIDAELFEEEQVNVYEIPEEFAEGSAVPLTEGSRVEEEAPFEIEASGENLIDRFMLTDVPGTEAGRSEAEEELTDAELSSAVEEEPLQQAAYEAASEPIAAEAQLEPEWVPESTAEEEMVVPEAETSPESFEEVFPTEEATDSEWSPELAAFGGAPEAVSEEVIEKPLTDEAVTVAAAPGLDEATLRRIVRELIEEKASQIIEEVAWDVIPDLAEDLIRKEIQRLQKEARSS